MKLIRGGMWGFRPLLESSGGGSGSCNYPPGLGSGGFSVSKSNGDARRPKKVPRTGGALCRMGSHRRFTLARLFGGLTLLEVRFHFWSSAKPRGVWVPGLPSHYIFILECHAHGGETHMPRASLGQTCHATCNS